MYVPQWTRVFIYTYLLITHVYASHVIMYTLTHDKCRDVKSRVALKTIGKAAVANVLTPNANTVRMTILITLLTRVLRVYIIVCRKNIKLCFLNAYSAV